MYIDDISVARQTIPYLLLNQTYGFENFTATDWFGWSADNGVWSVGYPGTGPQHTIKQWFTVRWHRAILRQLVSAIRPLV